LIDLGVIQPAAILNPAAFGFSLVVDIYCELEVGYQEQAIQAILEMPNVNYVAYSTGDQDISLHAIFRNSEEMHTFITQKLHPIPGMRHTRTVLLPRVLKDTHQWFPKIEIMNESSLSD
jgi:DNA-binding Lrp family transcriptional regulator